MRKFVIGFLCGAVLFASLPIQAAVEQYVLQPATYKVIADGKELGDPNYPILNYKGTTYLSLKKTTEAVNANLQWNPDKRQAEIYTLGTKDEKGEKVVRAVDVRSNIFDIPERDSAYKYVTVSGNEYLEISAFLGGNYMTIEGKRVTIEMPGRQKYYTDVSIPDDELFINEGPVCISLKALGLTSRLEGDTLWLE